MERTRRDWKRKQQRQQQPAKNREEKTQATAIVASAKKKNLHVKTLQWANYTKSANEII